MRLGVVGIEGQRLLIAGGRVGQQFLFMQGIAQDGVDCGVIGVRGDGMAEMPDGLIQTAHCFQDKAQFYMYPEQAGVDPKGGFVAADGFLEAVERLEKLYLEQVAQERR